MYILQLSDFHIYDSETEESKHRYEIITDAVIGKIINTHTFSKGISKEKMLVLVCGDIIDQKEPSNIGKTGGYRNAEVIMNKLSTQLSSYFDVVFGFVPGNHDKVSDSFDEFFNFVSKYGFNWDSKEDSCFSIEIENIDFVFINSVKGDTKRGLIDFVKLEKLLNRSNLEKQKVFVLHHTLMSMDDNDTSSIINAAKLVTIIEKYAVSLILHGHTHGLDSIAIGSNRCTVLGVGALFCRNYIDVNSQFNFITLKSGILDEVINFTYHYDNHTAEGTAIRPQSLTIPWKKMNNIFYGNKISEAYNKLISSLHVNKRLYNIVISGTYDFVEFEKDVTENFGNKRDFSFDYYTLASKWQSDKCPDEIFFSHGEYYFDSSADKRGIDYIIEMLQNKRTSSRAVLSTIDMRNIYSSEEDCFLPSLMVIQFGFDSDTSKTLKITLYLRALEANRFLKINICEILYLAKEIKKATKPRIEFDNIDVTINAFRVQNEENFYCFVKSELDNLSAEDIQEIVMNEDYDRIAKLLEGKNKYSETVVVSTGIEILKKKIDWYCSKHKPYPPVAVSAIEDVAAKLKTISEVRKGTSLYSELDSEESQLRDSIDKAVQVFRGEIS